MCTQAYGKRTLAIKLVYVLLFGLSIVAVARMSESGIAIGPIEAAMVLVPLAVLSLVLVNAQAVTALTSERDAHALDLLLVTDITPREFVFGKLGGILYNTKEMVLLPMALCVYLWYQRAVGGENLIYLLVGLGVMNVFVAMLGIHVGMAYANSRTAIATSLGTVFFLFVGVAVCMRIMVAFSGSFQVQLAPFVALLLGGGIGLFVALGVRNPSSAIFWASFGCPAATFYAITSFLVGMPLAVFSVIAFTYGFTTLAMLVPAIYGFDVATGRTVGGDD